MFSFVKIIFKNRFFFDTKTTRIMKNASVNVLKLLIQLLLLCERCLKTRNNNLLSSSLIEVIKLTPNSKFQAIINGGVNAVKLLEY